MSTTTLAIRSAPTNRAGATEAGATPVSAASVWGFGSTVLINENTNGDIYIAALQFQVTAVLSVDTTEEVLFEIVIGAKGSEVTKVQIPYSYRSDTAVSIYLGSQKISLAEPVFIPKSSRVSVRVADNNAASRTYNAVKIIYMSQLPLIEQDTAALPNNYKHAESASAGVISLTEKNY